MTLVQVVKPKLVLGKSVYREGDIFDCRATEACALIQTGTLKAAPSGSKASRLQWPPAIEPYVRLPVQSKLEAEAPRALVHPEPTKAAPPPPPPPKQRPVVAKVMRVQVLKPKLVLGKCAYTAGDVFDCRATEARALIHTGTLWAAPPGLEATRPSWPPKKNPFAARAKALVQVPKLEGDIPAQQMANPLAISAPLKAAPPRPPKKPFVAKMLVQVLKSRLVLGKSVYKLGDIFECRASAETRGLIQIGALKLAPSDSNATRLPPTKKPFVARAKVQKRPPPLRSLRSLYARAPR
jgi:hypothetical protein